MGRFWARGIEEWHFVPTITTLSAPTVAQIAAGDELTDEMADMSGFGYENQPIDVPDQGDTFTSQIDGPDQAMASSITLYDDDAGIPALKTLLAKGGTGYIVISPYGGVAAADKVEVWPVKVTGNNRSYNSDTEGKRYVVTFAITGTPSQNATVAA